MGSRYSDLSHKERRVRIEALRENAWYRSRGEAALTEAQKNAIRAQIVKAAKHHDVHSYDRGAWHRLVDNALPRIYNDATLRAGVEYGRSIAAQIVGRKGVPVKRQLRAAMAALRARGVSSRRAAELLYAAGQQGTYRMDEDEEDAASAPECETCNKKHGGYHFHHWEECPNNPLND